jgi:hypothetical protein
MPTLWTVVLVALTFNAFLGWLKWGLSMLNGDDDTTKFQREMTFIMWIVAALLAAIGVRP